MTNFKTIMNKLKIKRVFAYAIYNRLRNVPPKDYPTTAEIKSTISVILPALKEHLAEYLEKMKRAEDLSVKINSKELTEERIKAEVEAVNESFRTYNKEHGNDLVEVELDGEGLKTLRTQFERDNWGKNWLANIEEFSELADAFAEAGK